MRRSSWRLAGLLIVAVFAAWLLIRGYADYLARPVPERALSMNANQPEALVAVAERALVAGALGEAEAAATRVLYLHPFEGRALRVLGAVAELRGDRDRALALMRLTETTTPRESSAQFWLAINALVDKDLDGTLRRLDRLLRFEPETQRKIFPILGVIAFNPVGAGPLGAYLAADPPWRDAFMTGVIGGADSDAALSRLFRAIEAAGGRITESELDRLAGRLLARRDWKRLHRLLATMAPDAPAGQVRDGGFDGVGRGPLLGWAIGPKLPGADVLMAATDGNGNRTLYLAFHDRRVPFRQVSQVLLLQPGRYQFFGRARLQDLRTANGLGWDLSCVGSSVLLGKSERMLGSHDWRKFSFRFEVPKVDCGAQVLQLVLDARIAAEQHIVGKAWFDDFRIESMPTPAEATANAPADIE
jgi:hypothetical protein